MNSPETKEIQPGSGARLDAFFEGALALLPAPMLIVDEDRCVHWLNDAARQIVRRSRDPDTMPPAADALGLDAKALAAVLPQPYPPPGQDWGRVRVRTRIRSARTLQIRRQTLERSDGRRFALLLIESAYGAEEVAWHRTDPAQLILLESDLNGVLHRGGEPLAASLGLNPKVFAAQPFFHRMAPASRDLLQQLWSGLEAGSSVRDFECSLIDTAGNAHPFNLTLLPIQDAQGRVTGVRTIASDMAAQRELAHALEASEERFVALFREASDPILILSFDGDILSVNDTFEAVTGLRSQQMFRGMKSWKDFVFAQDLDALLETLERCRREQANGSCEFRMIRSEGDPVWVEQRITVLHDSSGKSKGFLSLCRNIQARKELEYELRQEAATMQKRHLVAQTLIERLKEFFTATSALPLELQGFLEGICEILDRMYAPSLIFVHTISGHHVFRVAADLKPTLDRAGQIVGVPTAMCREALDTGNSFISNRLQDDPLTRDDELVNTLDLRTYFGAPLRDSTGTIHGIIALLDRTSRSPDSLDVELITVASLQIAAHLRTDEQDQARRDLESHLGQSQKMEALGMLAGGIAHDFNNILSGILGFSSHLVERSQPGTPLYNDLRLIETSAERAAQLTGQLLAFARRKHFPKEPVCLNAVIDETLAILRRSLGKHIRIEINLEPELPDVLGDAGQLGQVVMNLCLNAAEAMSKGDGTLSITSDRDHFPDHQSRLAALDGYADRQFLHLQIADSGLGMTDEVKSHIFDPFFTTKSRRGGSGLGLSIVYGIVTNHGGDIIVESCEGQGATFHVYLPIYTGEGVVRTALPAEDLSGTETILVVDDELIVRQMVAEILSAKGYTVIALESGDAAIEQYTKWHGQVDLVLLDMVMPGRDGEDTFHELGVLDPGLPILLTSGYAQEDVTDRLLAEGARGLVYKPYKSTTLLTHIRHALQPA